MKDYREIISDAMNSAAVSSPEKLRKRKMCALTEVQKCLAYYEQR